MNLGGSPTHEPDACNTIRLSRWSTAMTHNAAFSLTIYFFRSLKAMTSRVIFFLSLPFHHMHTFSAYPHLYRIHTHTHAHIRTHARTRTHTHTHTHTHIHTDSLSLSLSQNVKDTSISRPDAEPGPPPQKPDALLLDYRDGQLR